MTTARALLLDNHLKETWTTMGVVLVLSIVAGFLGGAAPALAVVVLPLAYYYLFRAPFWVSARMLALLGLFIEPPAMSPGATYWVPPLLAADNSFYGTLKNLTGVPGGSMSFFFVATCILLYRAYRRNKDHLRNTPSMKLMRSVCVTFVIGLFAIEAWGMIRGGKVEPSFFQAIQILAVPLVTMALAYSIRGSEDLNALGNIVVSVAVARGALVAFTYFVICLPAGITAPEYCTTHGDSTTFAAALLILVAHVIVDRKRRTVWRLGLIGSFLLAAMVMNNRRLAFVCVGVGAMAMYIAMPPSRTRRRLNRILLLIGPLLFVYLIAGEGTTHPVFAPARLAWSALEQKDLSADSRDVENVNLVVTLTEHPILGSGFGHEYIEALKIYDISEFMPLYRYIPHNSLLWLWTVAGLVGFFWLWTLPLFAAYMGGRAFRLSEGLFERVASLVCVGIVAVWISANWGDVGLASETNVMIFAIGLAIAVRLNAQAEYQASTGG